MLYQVKPGIANLLTKLIAPAAVIQGAIPDMFKNTPDHFLRDTMQVFEENASLCYGKLKDVPGLAPVMPEGAMYMMVSQWYSYSVAALTSSIAQYSNYYSTYSFFSSIAIVSI